MRSVLWMAAAGLLAGAVGCEFGGSSKREIEGVRASTNADIQAMHDEIGRLRVEVEALGREIRRGDQALRTEIAAVRASVDELEKKTTQRTAGAVKELAAKIDEIERKRIGDKNALNDKMNAIVAEVRKALGTAGGPTPGRTQRGFKHVVKEGETVWGIAKKYRDKYGTTVEAILEANGLTATSVIRPGNTLFIPIKE